MLYQIHSHTIRITPKDAFDYVAHAHSYYEITLCTRGEYAVSCNFKDTVLKEGDIMIAFSNDVHSYNTSKDGEAILLLFDPELLKPYVNENERRENVLRGALDLKDRFLALLNEFSSGGSMEIMVGYLHLIMGELWRRLPKIDERPCVSTDQLSRILCDLSENYTQKISLRSLSKKHGVSAEHLSRTFSQKLSCNFLSYLHILRIEHAKNLLKHTEKGILEIGYESGFSDQRTFNRVFRELEGTTPKEYRASYKAPQKQ